MQLSRCCAGVYISLLDLDECLIPHLVQIIANRRVHQAHVVRLLYVLLHILVRPRSARRMLHDFQDDVALPRENRIGVLARREIECLVLKHFGKLAPFVLAQIAAGGRRGAVAEAPRQLRKVSAGVQPRLNVVRLCFGRRNLGRIVGSLRPRGNQNLAQPHALRLCVILFVLLVVPLHLAGSHLDMLANFLPHHLLGDDLVADVGLEVLEGHALVSGRLLQIVNRIQVVLLADLVQALYKFRFTGDVQFLALREPQLLVDQVAQQIPAFARYLLHRCAVLPSILVQLGFRTVVV